MTPAQLFDLNASRFGSRASAIMCEYRIVIGFRRSLRQMLGEFERGEVLPTWKFHDDNAKSLRQAIEICGAKIDALKALVQGVTR